METIYVWRSPEGDDYAEPVPISEWRALVAPRDGGEFAEVGRAGVIIGYTIYIEDQGATGILETDLIEVRSRLVPRQGIDGWQFTDLDERRRYILPVEGIVGEWYHRDGRHKGDQLAVKAVIG